VIGEDDTIGSSVFDAARELYERRGIVTVEMGADR
jgi:hypothetical protein